MVALILVLALFSPIAHSENETIDFIVYELSLEANKESIATNTEFYGVILQDESGALRHIKGKSLPGMEVVTFSYKRGETETAIAFWHTHGSSGDGKEYFSDYDTAAAKEYNIPIYMMDSTYTLRVFYPKDKTLLARTADREGFGKVRGIAKGSIVK